MSKLGLIAVTALLMSPAFAFASQGSGTGQDSVGGRSYVSSQGSGTGQDSVGMRSYLSSQGSGTGQNSVGAGDYLQSQGSGTGGSVDASGSFAARALRRPAADFSCLMSLRCLLAAKW